jgi:hypothetical protein
MSIDEIRLKQIVPKAHFSAPTAGEGLAAPEHRRDERMRGIRSRSLAIFATWISIATLLLVLVSGGTLLALENLLSVIGLRPGAGVS